MNGFQVPSSLNLSILQAEIGRELMEEVIPTFFLLDPCEPKGFILGQMPLRLGEVRSLTS
jgi:hypothetical protein